MTTENQTSSSIKTVLANSNFRKLWIGQTVSQIGDGITNLAILIVINNLTGSSTALGIMMVVIALPQLIFGLFSGVFVDRWDRKRIMIVSDLIRGMLVMGLVLVHRPEDIWIFYVLGFLQAVVGTFFNPARTALVPSLLRREDLLPANALAQTTQVITGVIGSALAGILIAVAGSAWPAFVLDGFSFLLSAFFILQINAPHRAAEVTGSVSGTFRELIDGLGYMFSRRMLVGVITTFAVTMLGLGAVNVLIVPFLTNQINVRTEALGIIEAAQVIGMVLGSGLVAVLAARLKVNQVIVTSIMVIGLMVGLFGASPTLIYCLVSLFFIGLFTTPAQAAAATVLQQTIPDHLRGRAGSAMNTVITLASVISMACAGLLGDALGVRQVFYLAGGITILAGLIAAVLMRSPVEMVASQPSKVAQ